MVLVIYMLLGVAFSVVAVVALPLLLPPPKPPPEAYKSPGPPKLAIKSYMLGELYARSRSWVSPISPIFSKFQLVNDQCSNKHSKDSKPILVKVDPEISDDSLEQLMNQVKKHNIRGIIATNTTVSRPQTDNLKSKKISRVWTQCFFGRSKFRIFILLIFELGIIKELNSSNYKLNKPIRN